MTRAQANMQLSIDILSDISGGSDRDDVQYVPEVKDEQSS